jgi:peptidyl-prolyl cis-trans isomerase D
MATLQKIRDRGSLAIAIVIGIALAAFILGDMLNSGSKLLRPSQLKIAEIDGEKIEQPDFQRKVEELVDIYKMNSQKNQIDESTTEQIKDQVWQEILQENTLGKAIKNLGIEVTSEELFDLVQGENPHQIIQQLFRNQETGQVDKSSIIQFLKSLETGASPEQKAYWLFIENQIVQDKLRSKYNNMVSKGLYVTSTEAQRVLDAKNKNVNFRYVALNYSLIPDTEVKLDDKELEKYYNENKSDFKQEKTRKIEYINFEVVASPADIAATQKWLEDAKSEFASVKDNKQYLSINSDAPFDPSYTKKQDTPFNLREWAFAAQQGDIFGPYMEGNAYKLAKIDEFKFLPDSVQASHILINPQEVGGVEKAQALADSLKRLLNNGANFIELAIKYSSDKGSAMKGGDLGWFKRKQMVPEFEEAAFNGELNKITEAKTQFGIHLVKPTKKGIETNQVRIAIMSKNIAPSTETYQKIYAEASKFASENTTIEAFNKAVVEQKLDKKQATLKETDREVPGLSSSRQLVRSAFSSEVNDVIVDNSESTIFEFGNKFVIGVLTGATEEGTSTYKDAKENVEIALRKVKKTQQLISKLSEAASGQSGIDAVASKLSTEVKEASNINFESYSIPSLGNEPALIGTVCSLPEGKLSKPVEGSIGVFIASVSSINKNTNSDVKGEQTTLSQSLGYRASAQTFESLKKLAEIEDLRSKFY